MKKALIAIIFFALTLVLAKETTYPQMLIVKEINEETDTMTLETLTGIEYQTKGTEDNAPGDILSAVMFNGFTQNIKDDTPLTLKYSGHLER